MPGGIRFDRSTVTVNGDVVNIEGNQINVGTATSSELLKAIGRIVASASSAGDLVEVLNQLEPTVVARGDIGTDNVAATIEEEIGALPQSKRTGVQDMVRQIGAGVTSGVLVQGVVLGVRAALGA